MRDSKVQLSCNPLGYDASVTILNCRQGDPHARRRITRAKPPPLGRVSTTPLATNHGSRLHQLAGDAALQPHAEGERVDGWLAPLLEEIDLPRYEEIQHEWSQRDCPDGVISRLSLY